MNKNLEECKRKLLCYDIYMKGSTKKNKSRWLVSISDLELCTKKKYIKQQWFILYGLVKGYIFKETATSISTSNPKTVATDSCEILLIHHITLHHIPEVIHPTTTKNSDLCSG
jgi:hypothetical protein